MCEAVGEYEVRVLHRRSVMGIELGGLPGPGAYRALEGDELGAVLDAVAEAESAPHDQQQTQRDALDMQRDSTSEALRIREDDMRRTAEEESRPRSRGPGWR